MIKKTLDIESFQYDHIFKLLLDMFKFNEKEYGNYIKDTLTILLELEKKGETIIEIDKSSIIFDFLEDGWPNKHI